MEELEAKMGQILNDPDIMKKIMSMAQAISQPSEDKHQAQTVQSPAATSQTAFTSLPDIDFSTLQRISGLLSGIGTDNNQKTLLQALRPYLTFSRIDKLEKAMRAAKMAKMASSFLGQTGLLNPGGK